MSTTNKSPPRPRLVAVEPPAISSSDSDTSPVITSISAFPPRPPMQRTKGFRGEPPKDDTPPVPFDAPARSPSPTPARATSRAHCLALARVVAEICLVCYILYTMAALSMHSPGAMQGVCRGPLVWESLAAQMALLWLGCLSSVVSSRCPGRRTKAVGPVVCIAIPAWALAEAARSCVATEGLGTTAAPDGRAAHLRILRGISIGWASMMIPSLAAAAVMDWRKELAVLPDSS